MNTKLYKVYGVSLGKMKTFKSQAEMEDFVKHNLNRMECIFIELEAYEDEVFFDINILEETENGMEYINHANLILHQWDTDIPEERFTFSWGRDGTRESRQFPTMNKALKDYIRREMEEREEPENTRYSIYDVYSTRELL